MKHLFLALMFWLLKFLDPFWKDVDIEKDVNYKKYWQGISALALYYFCQLAIYRLMGIMSKFSTEIDKITIFNGEWWQMGATFIGASFGALFLTTRRKNKPEKDNSLKILLIVSAVFLVGGVLFISSLLVNIEPNKISWVYYSGKFLFGLGWACGIGATIIWIIEALPPHIRTSSAMYIGAIGFLGAAVTTGVDTFIGLKDLYLTIIVILLGVFIILILISFYLPEDSSLNYAFAKRAVKNKNRKKWYKNRKLAFLVIISGLIGLSVQYSTFLVSNYSKIRNVEVTNELGWNLDKDLTGEDNLAIKQHDKFKVDYPLKLKTSLLPSFREGIELNPSIFPFLRYLFAFLAFLFFGYRFRKTQNHIDILSRLQLGLFFTLVIYSLLWQFNFNCFYSIGGFGSLSAFTGVFAIIWIVALLAIGEQFSLNRRVWILILAPNVFRVIGDGILLLRTGNLAAFSGDITLGVLLWGLVFAFVSWVLTLGMKEEADRIHSDKISTAKVRKKIIGEQDQYEHKTIKEYLTKTNKILLDHLKNLLKEQLYYGTLYYKEQGIYQPIDIHFNKDAFQAYSHNHDKDNLEQITNFHQGISDLIKKGQLFNFSGDVANNEDYNSGVIWYSPGDNDIEGYNKDDYRIINLNDYILEPKYSNLCQKLYEADTQIEEYVKTIETEKNKEKRLFNLLRADAERYIHGRYFLYVIRPYSKGEVVLVLKTTRAFTEKQLEELRSLVSFIETKNIRERTDEERRRFFINLSKSLISTSSFKEIHTALANTVDDNVFDKLNSSKISFYNFEKEIDSQRFRMIAHIDKEKSYGFDEVNKVTLALDEENFPLIELYKNRSEDDDGFFIVHDAEKEFYHDKDRPPSKIGSPCNTYIFKLIKINNELVGAVTLQHENAGVYQDKEEEYKDLLGIMSAFLGFALEDVKSKTREELHLSLMRNSNKLSSTRLTSHMLSNFLEHIENHLEGDPQKSTQRFKFFLKQILATSNIILCSSENELIKKYIPIYEFNYKTKIELDFIDKSELFEDVFLPSYVLLNCVHNSIKYTFNENHEKVIKITIEILFHKNENNYEIIVSDNGEGIVEEDWNKRVSDENHRSSSNIIIDFFRKMSNKTGKRIILKPHFVSKEITHGKISLIIDKELSLQLENIKNLNY